MCVGLGAMCREMLYISPLNNHMRYGASAIGRSLTLRNQDIV